MKLNIQKAIEAAEYEVQYHRTILASYLQNYREFRKRHRGIIHGTKCEVSRNIQLIREAEYALEKLKSDQTCDLKNTLKQIIEEYESGADAHNMYTIAYNKLYKTNGQQK